MYTRGHIMHREINNRVIIAALHLRYPVIAYLLMHCEGNIQFDRVEELWITDLDFPPSFRYYLEIFFLNYFFFFLALSIEFTRVCFTFLRTHCKRL